jgi:hypothetical protein
MKAVRKARTNAILENTKETKVILEEAKTNAIVEEARTKAILEARTTAILEEAEAKEAEARRVERTAQIEAEIAKFHCMGYLLERGLPPLGKCQISCPSPRYIKQESFGKPVHRMDGELFAVLADVDLPRVRSSIWIQANGLDGDLSSLGSLGSWYHVLCTQQKVDRLFANRAPGDASRRRNELKYYAYYPSRYAFAHNEWLYCWHVRGESTQ